MPEIQLFVDNYLEFGKVSIDNTKITASNSFIYIPAKLLLHPIKPAQHFNINEIECSLLLNNSEISNSTIKLDYNSTDSSCALDILCKFAILDNNIKNIEQRRKDGDIELGLALNVHLELLPVQGSKREGKKTSANHLNLKIFRSQWEDILTAFGYQNTKHDFNIHKSRIKNFLKEHWSTIPQLLFGIWDVLRDFIFQRK